MLFRSQIKNLLRNNYKNFARPCLGCPHQAGQDECSFTASGLQDQTCPIYDKWAKTKRNAYNMKLAVPLENHAHEVAPNTKNYDDIERLAQRVSEKMKTRVSERYYVAYKMLFVENKTEEEVAEFMGYKSSEKNRKAGYKQIKNLKDIFKKHVLEIIEIGRAHV